MAFSDRTIVVVVGAILFLLYLFCKHPNIYRTNFPVNSPPFSIYHLANEIATEVDHSHTLGQKTRAWLILDAVESSGETIVIILLLIIILAIDGVYRVVRV